MNLSHPSDSTRGKPRLKNRNLIEYALPYVLMSPDAKPNRLGWLQLSILTMVWNKEMYGLEIQKHLKIRGYPIATTQLYSALNNLERIEALKVNVVLRAGASRKYYIATEIGKKLVMDFFVNFLILFQERIWEKFNPFLEDICSKLNGVEGKEIVDFSEFYSDQMFETLISPLAIHNRYNIICESAEVKDAYEDQMKLFDNKDNIFPLKIMEKKTDIPTNSMDYAFCFFSLHAEGYDWIIPEMSRVLRTDGIGIILEINAPEGDYPFLSFLLEFVTPYLQPAHTRIGIPFHELEQILTSQGFQIMNNYSTPEINYFFIQKSD